VFVYLPERGRLERRTIRVGLANWDYTEVVEGLRAGEQVVVNVDRPGIDDDVAAIPTEPDHD
jgi:HlyD family secretion protein